MRNCADKRISILVTALSVLEEAEEVCLRHAAVCHSTTEVTTVAIKTMQGDPTAITKPYTMTSTMSSNSLFRSWYSVTYSPIYLTSFRLSKKQTTSYFAITTSRRKLTVGTPIIMMAAMFLVFSKVLAWRGNVTQMHLSSAIIADRNIEP